MSVTGPGCEKCNFTGRVRWDESPGSSRSPFGQKPCDHCGGLSQLGDPAKAAARASEAEAICKALAESNPVSYDEWIQAVNGSGLRCYLCDGVESERTANVRDLKTSQHAASCPWLRARAWVAKP